MEEYACKRMHERESYNDAITFTGLFMRASDFIREDTSGEILDASKSGLGLVTTFPLEAGHVLEWDDRHQEGNLHIAMVRWAERLNDHYRAGVMFI